MPQAVNRLTEGTMASASMKPRCGKIASVADPTLMVRRVGSTTGRLVHRAAWAISLASLREA